MRIGPSTVLELLAVRPRVAGIWRASSWSPSRVDIIIKSRNPDSSQPATTPALLACIRLPSKVGRGSFRKEAKETEQTHQTT